MPVKMQAHNTTAQGKVYKNAFHCTSRILLDEGIRGLYKGASSSFIGIAVESSLFFGSYSQAKQLLQGNSEDGRPQLQVIIPSAACSGALISCILTPTELTKCRMQVQGKNTVLATRYSSPLDCAMKTLEAEGIYRRAGMGGCYAGLGPTLARAFPANAAAIVTWEYSAKILDDVMRWGLVLLVFLPPVTEFAFPRYFPFLMELMWKVRGMKHFRFMQDY
ncbi:hypothetical protein PR202_ga31344 [Eleusine coracana subsp. coracana]|uniref:Uncharacterized protein n=1 Tax=Eleusine coracana subsp. coracana TaxID=191504 RepID=A0AAV5DS82_ELECO|nr:hypothetical protein PR202_ga31344 [Eleusine coracana subsp. coracana]